MTLDTLILAWMTSLLYMSHSVRTFVCDRSSSNSVSLREYSIGHILIEFLCLGRGELTPRHLRIFANHPNVVDFSDAETLRPNLDISLLEGETTVTEYPLRAASFTNVHSLSLHFVST